MTTPIRKNRWFDPGFILLALMILGCSMSPEKQSHVTPIRSSDSAGEFLSGKTGGVISFDEMIRDLSDVDIIYIGETHTNPQHHYLQYTIIQVLHKMGYELTVGMEMIDHTYQKVLDEWTSGGLDESAFLEKTHWYANWRYDFELYRNILLFLKQNKIPLLGLNIPFHIPPKISIGGIDSLSEEEQKHLPERIDITYTEHRAYISEIFKAHRIKGRNNFEYFYLAQCTWEDAMAERIASGFKKGKIIVLAGNGHIIKKFGIPDRAFARVRKSFRTLYLSSPEEEIDPSFGDYIWIGFKEKGRN
ncbi:MAG: ChaN family lipoprotein [Thermodesulfobacteriota bacterium]